MKKRAVSANETENTKNGGHSPTLFEKWQAFAQKISESFASRMRLG